MCRANVEGCIRQGENKKEFGGGWQDGAGKVLHTPDFLHPLTMERQDCSCANSCEKSLKPCDPVILLEGMYPREKNNMDPTLQSYCECLYRHYSLYSESENSLNVYL